MENIYNKRHALTTFITTTSGMNYKTVKKVIFKFILLNIIFEK